MYLGAKFVHSAKFVPIILAFWGDLTPFSAPWILPCRHQSRTEDKMLLAIVKFLYVLIC